MSGPSDDPDVPPELREEITGLERARRLRWLGFGSLLLVIFALMAVQTDAHHIFYRAFLSRFGEPVQGKLTGVRQSSHGECMLSIQYRAREGQWPTVMRFLPGEVCGRFKKGQAVALHQLPAFSGWMEFDDDFGHSRGRVKHLLALWALTAVWVVLSFLYRRRKRTA